jgi:hypothetical protein
MNIHKLSFFFLYIYTQFIIDGVKKLSFQIIFIMFWVFIRIFIIQLLFII